MIKFGTSGWRGIIAEDFTVEKVKFVTQAIVEYIKSEGKQDKGVIIGYDPRFMSEKFAETSARVLAGNNIKAYLCNRDTPTPVIAYEIVRNKLAGGINFTASHNPPQYSGLKFSPSWGGPALPDTTKFIEEKCNALSNEQIKTIDFNKGKQEGLIKIVDPKKSYFSRVAKLINFRAIKKSKLKIATDVLYGTGNGYLDALLEKADVRQKVIHNWRDVLFGGNAPEPSNENLKELKEIVKKESCHLGLSTDGDADRFGIIDSDGSFINPNQTIAVLLYHLIKNRGWKGVVARSVMTTHLIDKLAKKFGLELKETPVGFKYIGEIMVSNENDFMIGGEESGGLTIRNHVPEKDGVVACLLVAEMVAVSKKSVNKILAEITKLVGPVYSDRINFHLTKQQMENLRDGLKSKVPKTFGSFKVKKVITLDGYKFILDHNSWLGIRLSGTEPVVRLYLESDSLSKINKLKSIGKKYILS